MAEASEAWSATGSWRGDYKLFARIVDRATSEVAAKKQSAAARIEFAVRDDLETYESSEDLLERVPFTTWKYFRSARIAVGGDELRVEVEFGRKKAREQSAFNCPRGVSVRVSSDGTVDGDAVREVRSAVSKVVERGGFSWVKPPTEGPTRSLPILDHVLASRWRERILATHLLASAAAIAIVLAVFIASLLIPDDDSLADELASSFWFALVVSFLVQGLSHPVSMRVFPPIEVADTTPGRRMIKVIGGSGVISAAVGLGAAYLKSQIG